MGAVTKIWDNQTLRTLGIYLPTAYSHKEIPSKMGAGLILPAVSCSCTFYLQVLC